MTATEIPAQCHDGEPHLWRYGGISRVPHPRCDQPTKVYCERCRACRVMRCRRTSRRQCEPCGRGYRQRVRRIFASGWCDNPTKLVLLLTLTAPGDGLHTRGDGKVCACTPEGGINVAEWNSFAGKRFNEVITYLRRRYGKVEYARGAEVQDGKRRQDGKGRGALHFHVLLRVEHARQLLADFSARDPDCPLRLLVMDRGFGHSVDLQRATHGAAWYCAKYVSKSADARARMPWLDRRTGEITTGNGRYRPWSASKRWGLTMAQVRAAQAAWASQNGPASPEPSGAPQPPLAAAEAPEAPRRGAALDPNTHRYTNDGPARRAGSSAGRRGRRLSALRSPSGSSDDSVDGP